MLFDECGMMVVTMDTLMISIVLLVLGTVAGSFAGATVWRLRARQLKDDEEAGEKVSAKEKNEVKKLKKVSVVKDRSVCLHCGHTLHWMDLIPFASWLFLRGKCRYCGKPIGVTEPLIEVALAAYFVMSYIWWPAPLIDTLDIVRFVLWLIAGTGLAILVVYDSKWFLLPNRVVFPLIGVGVLYAISVFIGDNFSYETASQIVLSCMILSGLYYVIYEVSHRQWVGFGDVKLGLALALLLSDWSLAILALFLANVIGTLFVLPLMFNGKVGRKTHIPFGPLLIAGWFIAGIFGNTIIEWYLGLM